MSEDRALTWSIAFSSLIFATAFAVSEYILQFELSVRFKCRELEFGRYSRESLADLESSAIPV